MFFSFLFDSGGKNQTMVWTAQYSKVSIFFVEANRYFCPIIIKTFVSIALIIFFSNLLISAEQISLYPGVGSFRVTEQGYFLKDGSGNLNIYQILEKDQDDWNRIPKNGFKKPFDARPYWIKIPVRCSKSGIFFFQSTYVILEDFGLYVHNNSLGTTEYMGNLGLKFPHEKNDIIHSSLVFRLALDQGMNYTFYLRLNKRFSTTAIPFYIRDSGSFVKHVSRIDKERGIIYGIFFMLVFQGVVLWLFFREHVYIRYAGYIITSFLILFISDGTFRFFFSKLYFDAIHFSVYFIIPTCFSFVFLVLFDLLNTRTHFPGLVKLSWWVIGVSYFFSVINSIAYFFVPSFPLILFRLTNVVVLLYPLLFILICIKTYFLNTSKQALVLLGLFSLTLLFVLFFAFLPFLTYRFEWFSSFKWIILFEGVMLMLIINRDLYLNKISKIRLLQELSEQKELVTHRYLDGLLDERKRIASDLHDSLSAKISAYKIQLSGFNFSDIQQKSKALADLDELHYEVRNAAHALSPILLKEKGIKRLLEDYILKIEDSDLELLVDYSFEISENEIPSPHHEILYFSALELMNNVLNHAQAKSIKIILEESSSQYVLVVEDDGVGYKSIDFKQAGIGIKSIQERAQFLNGTFIIEPLEKGSKHVFTIEKRNNTNQ
jgi:signal transduction histidine kinase